MKKIAILGCENSHADAFLDFIYRTESYRDVEVVGVYSNEPEAAKKLNEKYGVKILKNYTDAKGKVDGIVITARHGALHYEYAKPYIESGIPMFIDKPVTISESEAVEFMQTLKSHGVRVSGGSSLKHDVGVKLLKLDRECNTDGKTTGGFVKAPINMVNAYGGFYFYAPHLVEVVSEIFGRYPSSVLAKVNGDEIEVKFNYGNYTVDSLFIEQKYEYYACRYAEGTVKGFTLESTKENNWFRSEFDEFYGILNGAPSPVSYEDFISSVFVMNAIERSINSGKEEKVNGFTV